MTLALTPHNRLAAPTDSIPMSPLPPQPPSAEAFLTGFAEPGDTETPPSYLLTAREHAEEFDDSPVALARLAQAEESASNTAAALDAAERALKLSLSNHDDPAAFAAGQLLLGNGGAAIVRALLSKVRPGSPLAELAAKGAIACGCHDDAERVLAGSDSLEALMLLGWLALERGKPRKAIQLLRTALREYGGTPGVFTNLGYAHAQLGELARAIRETREALALAPGDRLIAFNLVSFLSANGARAEAIAVLDRLEEIYPADVDLALARADVFSRFGDRSSAHRTLQRARTSTGMATASRAARAQLEANLAFMRWLTGRRSRQDTRTVVLEQLRISEYRSLPIVGLLPALLQQSSDVDVVESLLAELERIHPARDLLFMKVHRAIVRRESSEAVALARAWVENDPLNPLAASLAVQLTGDIAGQYQAAVDIGCRALRYAPHDAALINNVAYALAEAGRLRAARELLARVPFEDHVTLTATRALVDLLDGLVEEGLRGYRRAQALALQRKHQTLAWLVEAYCTLAVRGLDRELLDSFRLQAPDELLLSPEVDQDVNVWLFRYRAEREGLSLVVSEDANWLETWRLPTNGFVIPESNTRPKEVRDGS